MAITTRLPQFGDQYDGEKLRRLVQEIERLANLATAASDTTSSSSSTDTFAGLDDTTFGVLADNDLAFYDSGAAVWVNRQLANSDISSGMVTQHQASLSIAYTQLTGVPSTFAPSAHTHPLSEISDYDEDIYALLAEDETITGTWLHSTHLWMANNANLKGKDTGGTVRHLIGVSPADKTVVGNSTLDTQIAGASVITMGVDTNFLGEIQVAGTKLNDTHIDLDSIIGTPTYTTVHDWMSVTSSPGVVSGGLITDDTDGTVTVTAGTGFIRATDSDVVEILSLDWVETPITPTDADITYIYVEYNGGTPQVIGTITERTDHNTNIFLGTVQRTGTFLHPTNRRELIGNLPHLINERLVAVDNLSRASGAQVSETGTLNLGVDAGVFWLGLNEINFAAFDSSVADTFIYFYDDGASGWTVVGGETDIDNLQYDDGTGVLATLGTAKYGVHWVYIGVDDDVYVIYGTGSYSSTGAQDADPPASVPPHMQEHHAALAAKVIIRKSAVVFTSLESAWDTQFVATGITEHGDLAGLSDDDHPQYAQIAATEAISALWTYGVAPVINVAADAETSLIIGETSTVRGASQDSSIILYGESGGVIRDLSIKNFGNVLEIESTIGDVPLNIKENVNILGKTLVVGDSILNDLVTFQHDGTDFLATGTNTADIKVQGLTGTFWIQDGAGLKISDTTDADYGTFNHNGTGFRSVFVNTDDWSVVDLTGNFWIRDGAGLKISNAADTDFAIFNHDGVDFNTVLTQTADWNVSGATSTYSWETSGGGLMSFDGINLRADRNTNGTSRMLVGEETTLRGDLQVSELRLYGETSGVISYGLIKYSSDVLAISGSGTATIRLNEATEVRAGRTFSVYDASNLDSAALSHDGTDFNIAFTTTADWNITGLTGAVNFPVTANFVNATGGIQLENTAGTPQLVLVTTVTTDRVLLRNLTDSADIRLQATDSSSNTQNGYIFNADTGSTVYHGATNELALVTTDRTASDQASSLSMLSASGATVSVGEATMRFLTKNENYTFLQADHGRVFYKGNGTAYNWTTPASTNTEIPNGWWCRGIVQGANAVTILVGSGVNLRWLDGGGGAPSTGTRTIARAGEFLLMKRSDTEYYIKGTGIT